MIDANFAINTAVVIVTTVCLLGSNYFLASFDNTSTPSRKKDRVSPWKYLWERLTDPLGYVESVCFTNPGPIVSFRNIPFIGAQVLLVNSPEIASLIYRKSRVLSLYPLVKNLVRPLTISLTEYEGLNPNRDPTYPVVKELERITHTAMAPARIHDMHERGCDVVAAHFAEFTEDGHCYGLHVWLRNMFTLSSAAALYGRDNPVKDDTSLVDALEDYKNDEPILYLRILKPLTAPRGYKALKRFQAAFTAYYNADRASQASSLIQERYASYRKHWGNPSIAAVEVMILQAAVMNFTASVFWMLSFIFSAPDLLAELRKEIEAVLHRREAQEVHDGNGTPVARSHLIGIDTNTLLTSCPLLVSTWMETLRVTSCAVSARRAVEDTVLDGGHLIRKGATVNVIVAPMLKSPAIWGADVDAWVPRRFVTSDPDSGKLKLEVLAGVRKKAFLPFGGGASWCPGRHFVTHQVFFAVAAVVAGFELTAVDGDVVKRPEIGRIKFFEGVRQPEEDLQVLVKRTKGWEDARFEAVVDGSSPMVPLPF